MNKLLISFLLAFAVLFGSVSASLTAGPLSITVEQGLVGTATLNLSASDNVTAVVVTSNSDLSGTAGFIASSLISENPSNIGAINEGSSAVSTISVGTTGVSMGSYSGSIVVNYDNGTAQSLPVQITVIVTESTAGAHMTVPQSLDFQDLERETETPKEFEIENSGSLAITNLQYSITGFDSNWDVNLSGAPTSLSAGSKKAVTLFLTAPEDADADEDPYTGTLTITGTTSEGQISREIRISAEPENFLRITDLDVTVKHRNGDTDTEKNMDDGDDVSDDVFPGDEIEIEIEIENRNDDVDFDDGVQVEIDNDDELDVNEDDEQDINGGDKETYSFTFDVPDDADDGTQKLKIIVDGTDENGAYHKLEWEISFSIDKESDDIGINSIDFPSSVRCGQSARLEIEIENYGTDDQNEAQVRIEFPEWDIVDYERDIEIDEGDSETVTFTINIPSDAREGNGYVEVEAYYDRDSDSKTDDDSYDFNVVCGSSNNNNGNDDDDSDDGGIVIVPGDDSANNDPTAGSGSPTGNIVAVGQPSFFESTGYLVLLTGLVILLIIVIIAMLVMGRK